MTATVIPKLDCLYAEVLRSPIWVYDITGHKMIWANQAALDLWQADDIEELCGRDFSQGQSEAVKQTLLGYLERFERGELIDTWWEIEPRGNKKRVFCRLSGVLVETQADGEKLAMLIEGQYSPELLQGTGIPSAAMALIVDNSGSILSTNPPFIEHFGHRVQNLQDVVSKSHSMRDLLTLGQTDRELETVLGVRWHHVETHQYHSEFSESTQYVMTLIDIHERKLLELENIKRARSDVLTGLMNRRGLTQTMAGYQVDHYSVFYIDFDDFKPVNDNYGHHVGDELLCQLSNVLKTQEGETVCCRLGGDEFIIIFIEQFTEKEVRQKSTHLLDDLSRPFKIDDATVVSVSASIGVATYPVHSNDLDQLIKQADCAMYEAKKQGRNRAVLYQETMKTVRQ